MDGSTLALVEDLDDITFAHAKGRTDFSMRDLNRRNPHQVELQLESVHASNGLERRISNSMEGNLISKDVDLCGVGCIT